MNPTKKDLSIYVHIPFCKRKCIYCDFLSFENHQYNHQKQYIDALCKEIEAYKEISKQYTVRTIFIGGGTPSFIDPNLIVKVLDTIKSVFFVDQKAEITLEGNPDSLKKERLCLYKEAGINRLSIGLQSANDKSLRVLGRVHNYDQFVAAFLSAREVGFQNINIDIISGIPGEKMEEYIKTLAKIVELQPEHISAYSLIVEEDTVLAKRDDLLEILPSEEEDRKLYAKTKLLLKNSGYTRYEISNYAKSGFACQHNLVYWSGGEYLGLGLGASSYLEVPMQDNKKKIRFHGMENQTEYIGRFLNSDGMQEDAYTNMYHLYEDSFASQEQYIDVCDQDNFYAFCQEQPILEFIRDYYKDLYFLKRKDEMEEFMFLGLRKIKGVSKKEFYQKFGVTLESVYERNIVRYKTLNLLEEYGDRLFLTDAGIDVSNTVMADFML